MFTEPNVHFLLLLQGNIHLFLLPGKLLKKEKTFLSQAFCPSPFPFFMPEARVMAGVPVATLHV